MNSDEVRACITYANGIDPRVQMTAPNAALWGRTVGHYEAVEVTTAILVYYERPAPPGRDRPSIGASDVRKIIQYENERRIAHEDAHKAIAAPVRNPMSYRQRNPEEFERLMRKGRDEHRADLKSRGITPPNH